MGIFYVDVMGIKNGDNQPEGPCKKRKFLAGYLVDNPIET
jgi:hypothetical protein